jgi:hypothetical protein
MLYKLVKYIKLSLEVYKVNFYRVKGYFKYSIVAKGFYKVYRNLGNFLRVKT